MPPANIKDRRTTGTPAAAVDVRARHKPRVRTGTARLHASRNANGPSQQIRLVQAGTDAAEKAHLAANIYVADDGGPLRTVVGSYHHHWTGEEHSQKTGLSNPYEGGVEQALIIESELRADVLDYRTQAFRMQLPVGTTTREWICDHLRHIRCDGVDYVEVIECKPNISYLGDANDRARLQAIASLCAGLGWRFRVLYDRDVRGSGERQLNFGHIYAHKTVHVPDEKLAKFEQLVIVSPTLTFGALREALHPDRIQGSAMAHAMICLGRVEFDLGRYLCDASPVRLLPAPEFTSLIRF